MVITLAWWHIPTAVSVISALWFSWMAKDDDWGAIFLLIPVLVISLVAWFLGGLFK